MQMHTCLKIDVLLYFYMCIPTYTYLYHMHVQVHVDMCTYVYIYMHTYMCIYNSASQTEDPLKDSSP